MIPIAMLVRARTQGVIGILAGTEGCEVGARRACRVYSSGRSREAEDAPKAMGEVVITTVATGLGEAHSVRLSGRLQVRIWGHAKAKDWSLRSCLLVDNVTR